MTTARAAGLVGCSVCGRAWGAGVARCGRCGATLASRSPHSLQKVWAWWIVGVMAYVPANLFPMLRSDTLGQHRESTIIGGAIELFEHGDIGVSIIVLFASVCIPVGKFIAIAYLATSVRRGSQVPGHRRLQVYEIVEFIGRWSMIDVFVVAILSALVQLQLVATINPGPAALAFALSVVFTMLSAQAFDPRLIWDREEVRNA